MFDNSISKDALTNRFWEGLVAFQYSKASIERYLYDIRSLFSFMERKQFNYSRNVGEQYRIFSLLDARNSDFCRQRNLHSIHLLNIILEDKPYAIRRLNPLKYSYPGEMLSVFTIYLKLCSCKYR